MTVLARRKGFKCLHRYVVPEWTDSANSSTFGTCFTPHGHGHDFELEVYLQGPIDSQTGMILNLSEVDKILNEVIEPIDGKHLNFEVTEFKDKVPTTELIANFIFAKLDGRFPAPIKLVKMRLYEYADLWVDVWPN